MQRSARAPGRADPGTRPGHDLVQRSDATAALLDASGTIVEVNEAWRLFARLNDGSDATAGVGADYLRVCERAARDGDPDAAALGVGLRALLEGRRGHVEVEYPCLSPTEDRWYLVHATAVSLGEGPGVLVEHRDITSRKVLEQGWSTRPDHDPVTGLPDRCCLTTVLDGLLSAPLEDRPAAVLVADLVGLDEVEADHGRGLVDEVLVTATSRVRRVVGPGAVVARIEGDRLAAACPSGPPQASAELADRLRSALSRPYQVGATVIAVNPATGRGIAEAGSTGASLLADAEAAVTRDARHRRDERTRLRRVAARLPTAHRARPAPATPRTGDDTVLTELRTALAATEAILAHTNDLAVFFEGDGTITWASPSAHHIFGISPSDLVGRNGLEIIHPDDQARAFETFTTIPDLGDQVRVEFRIVTPSGDVRWVEEVATNLLDEPDVGYVVGHLRDITERRTAGEVAARLSAIVEASHDAIVSTDVDGFVITWNDGARALFGLDADLAVGRHLTDLVAADHVEALRAHLLAVGRGDGGIDVDAVGRRGDGSDFHVAISLSPMRTEAGAIIGISTVARDISERVEQRQRTEEDHRRLADAQASAHLGSFEVHQESRDLVGSDEFWRILGREPSRLEGFEHVHPEDRDRLRAAFAAALAGQSDVACTHRIVRPDGTIRWVISRSSQFHTATVPVLAGTMLDITERHEAELALIHQASHDPLTGLANRRLFVEVLEAALERTPGDGGRTAVLFIDLDDFKAVNDRIGHVDGDEILRTLGELIAAALPAEGTVGRLGGDEFVICCEGLGDAEDAFALVERIQRILQAPFRVRGEALSITASVGIALSGPEHRAEALLRNADVAMHAAKQAGRGSVELFDDALHQQNRRRHELAAEMRSALDAGQVVAHFQPEVSLATGRLVGFEALARWIHPERGLIAPDEFIPLAEESGLIDRLGRQMLDDACRALAGWQDRRADLGLTVAVNISPLQLADPTFPDEVRRAIGAAGVPAASVCLEVTESTLMDQEVGSEALRRLKEVGVTIAVDDFGTGYSSLSRLKRLPVDFLKIDRSFVSGLGRDAEDDVIVATVAGLAHSLGLQVIAEGIETEDQLARLTDLGCEIGQGYVWSRPLAAADADALVDSTGPDGVARS